MKKFILFSFFTLFNLIIYSQNIQMSAMFVDIDAVGNTIYVGTLGMGVIKSTNAGDSWFLASTGIEGKDVRSLAISPTNPNELVATIWNNCCPVGGFLGVYKSTNGGGNWTSISSGLSGDLGPIAYDPSNSNIIYVAGYFGTFYKTTNGGANWAPISGVFGDVNSLHVQSNGTIWAGGQGGLRKSTNGGVNWQAMSGIPSGNVMYIESISSDLNTLYVTINSSGDNRLLYKTTNGGTSWSQIGQSIAGGNALAVVNNSNTLFVGNKRGLYRTTDGGVNWSVIDTMNVLLATQGSLANGNLYLSSQIGGIRKVDNVTSVELNLIPLTVYKLNQNYPNPFNPSTKISYDIPTSGYVLLSVFDILGREVEVLVNEFQNQGSYEIKFDSENLASGVYFYRMIINNFVETKKMILVR